MREILHRLQKHALPKTSVSIISEVKVEIKHL